jgi:hypothetical protein
MSFVIRANGSGGRAVDSIDINGLGGLGTLLLAFTHRLLEDCDGLKEKPCVSTGNSSHHPGEDFAAMAARDDGNARR